MVEVEVFTLLNKPARIAVPRVELFWGFVKYGGFLRVFGSGFLSVSGAAPGFGAVSVMRFAHVSLPHPCNLSLTRRVCPWQLCTTDQP